MSEKKLIRDLVIEQDLLNELSGSGLIKASDRFAEWFKIHTAAGYTNLKIVSHQYYEYAVLQITGDRLETDKEYDDRINKSKAKKDAKTAKEREQYLKLKAKFDPED